MEGFGGGGCAIGADEGLSGKCHSKRFLRVDLSDGSQKLQLLILRLRGSESRSFRLRSG